VAGALALGAAGCDTAASISFPPRTFHEIKSSGFTAMPGSCTGVTDGDMKARFVLLDNNLEPIQLGDGVNLPGGGEVSVEPTSDSIVMSNAALMETRASACVDSSDCSSHPLGFQCEVAPGLMSSPTGESIKSCHVPEAGLSVVSSAEAVQFVADVENDQVYGILMESTGGLKGWSLPGTQDAWDANGDGVVNDEVVDGVADLEPYGVLYGDPIATDPEKKRVQALYRAYNAWVDAYTLARSNQRRTYFGLWSFNSIEAQPTSHIAEIRGDGLVWASDATPISQAMTDYSNTTADRSRANIYEAALAVIENAYSDEAMSKLNVSDPESVDKQLVLFVDGYDDMRENDSATMDDVITAAQENRVRVFVVHLDPAFEEPEQIREDPEYWKGQEPCVDDSTCKNYETCRKPRGYAPSMGAPVNEPDGFDNTYCLPERDDFGRVGPIHDYARLACATEGGYMYMPSADAISRNLGWTPYALDGLWEATVNSNQMQREENLGGIPLKIQADMEITIAGQSHTFSFSQMGEVTGVGPDATVDAFDTRSVVFTAE
jgi:hypothetical protein